MPEPITREELEEWKRMWEKICPATPDAPNDEWAIPRLIAEVERLGQENAEADYECGDLAAKIVGLRARVEELEVSARQMSTHIDRESESWVAEQAELIAERGALKRRVEELEKARMGAWEEGARSSLLLYAHWKDGVQYVGSCGTTLIDALRYVSSEKHRAISRAALGKED